MNTDTSHRRTRADVVSLARDWIGTPYHHQASLKHVGADCIGLVRGLFCEIRGGVTEAIPGYTRDWAEATGEETLLAAARRHLHEIDIREAGPGDILIFRFRQRFVAKHAGILATPETFVHAIEGSGVVEVPLGAWWRRRIAAAFRFPEVQD